MPHKKVMEDPVKYAAWLEKVRSKTIGQKRSEEAKQKMRDAKKGFVFSEEHKEKLASNNKWKTGSPEDIERWKKELSEKHKGLSGKHKGHETLAKTRKGKSWEEIFGPEKAASMRSLNAEKHKGKKAWNFGLDKNDPRIFNIVEKRRSKGNYAHTEETKRILSEKTRVQMANMTPAQKAAREEKIRQAASTPEAIDKRNAVRADIWENQPEKSAEWVRSIFRANRVSPNKCELHLAELLEKHFPGKFKFVGDGATIIDGKCPDFISMDDTKLIIEFNGQHWHDPEDEPARVEFFSSRGYRTMIVWEGETDEGIISRCRRFISS